MKTLSLGFSPCPNDTFMFHGLVHGRQSVAGVDWRVEMHDIEALNLAALEHPPRLDVTKLSLPALAHAIDEYAILDAGAALGHGCGPLVVAREADPIGTLADLAGRTVAIPGTNTTAFLLLRVFATAPFEVRVLRFDEVMPAVAGGEVDAGLIIHESRFTYREHGLREVADLGVLWEGDTGLPLPLGVITARRTLEGDLFTAVESALRESVQAAMADPCSCDAFVREHAQEMDRDVCRAHIELYVNDFSITLGDEGRAAIDELLARGRAVGHLPDGRSAWRS